MPIAGGPTGNVWLATEAAGSGVFVGDYNGATWTTQTTDVVGGIANYLSFQYNGYLYLYHTGELWYCQKTDLTDWTQIVPSYSAPSSGGQMATDGTYLYIATGNNKPLRMTLPSGAINLTSGGYNSTCVAVCNGKLFINRNSYNELYYSSDAGATFNPCTDFYSTYPDVSPAITSNGTRLVVAYADNPDPNIIKFKYSDDDGVNWSAVQHTITLGSGDTIDSNNALSYASDGYFFISNDGVTAFSTDAQTWTNGATVPLANTFIARGIGKIAVGTAENNIYETTDGGANWTQMPELVASTNSLQYAYIYWIGDPP